MEYSFPCYKCGRTLNLLNDRWCCSRLQGDISQSRGKVAKEPIVRRLPRKRKKRSKNLSPETRALVLKRDKKKCVRCGCRKNLHVHHKIHREHGGTDDLDNLETLCDICHMEEHREDHVYGLMMQRFWDYEDIK